MQSLARITGLAALTAIVMLSYGLSSAWADPADTHATIEFSPSDTVPEGTQVTITGRAFCDEIHGDVCQAVGEELTVGKIQIQPALNAADQHVDCASIAPPDHFGDKIGMGPPPFNMLFDTTGLGGQTLGFRNHYITPGGKDAPGGSFSDCADLTITEADPLPDDTLSYTQGFYGSSPTGEDLVDQLIDESTCEQIRDILNASGFDDTASVIDCSVPAGRDLLALFLTGTVGAGNDDGFLPAGNPSQNGPGFNLAAQKITLLLNLNLAALAEIPILSSYFINIDLVQDIVDGAPGPIVEPVFRNPDLYDFCEDTVADGEDICDAGTLVLSALGNLVQALDDASTTVEDLCEAAVAMISEDLDSVFVNGVEVTRSEMTKLLGLTNESYDEGTPTGFITSGDVD